jgi:hypothetical protein
MSQSDGNMKSDVTFSFSGQDSLSQFMVWILVLGAGCLPLPLLVWWFGGKTAAITSVVIALVVLVGLRASIAVSPSGVVITKNWFFVPYWRYKGPAIEDVWFGGDWGEPEGASGVVVKINGKEIHVGSRKSMHHLHAALLPLRVRNWQ